MKYKVRLRPDAETDIEKAAAYYEMQRKGLGDEFLDEILSAFKRISDNPYMYAAVQRQNRALIRHPKQWQKRT